jgi:hypothetical protein
VRRTAGFALPLLVVLLVSGCTTTVQGIASPGSAVARAGGTNSVEPALPGGARPSCLRLVDDGCDDDGSAPDGETGTHSASLPCSPLPAATEAFDAAASEAFPGGRISTTGTTAQLRELAGVVAGIVDGCGFKVLFDVADQYPEPVRSSLLDSAAVALGDLFIEPDGLRCADLQTRGYGAKDAVDYWFLWGAPPLMDADLDGVPCETVFSDVERYLPAYY